MPQVVPITVGTGATLLTAAKPPRMRQWVTVQLRRDESEDVYIGVGDAAVTIANGYLLKRGFIMVIENDQLAKMAANAIYAVCASGGVQVLLDEGS